MVTLIKIKDQRSKIKQLKSNLSLIISYFLFGIVFILIHYLIYKNINYVESSLVGLIKTTPSSIWEIKFFGILWFIVSLIVIKSVYVNLKYGVVFYLILFVVTSFIKDISWESIPLCLGPSFLLIVYFSLGKEFKAREYWIKANEKLLFMISVIVFIILAIYSLSSYGITTKLVNYHNNIIFQPIVAFMVAVAGGGVVFGISARLGIYKFPSQILSFIGRNSFVILVSHIFILWVLRKTLGDTNSIIILTAYCILNVPLLFSVSFLRKNLRSNLITKSVLG